LAIIMLDIDGFKNINDSYGHAAGDKVLRYLAHEFQKNIRKIDILGRYGGDEFIILLPEIDLFAGAGIAERLRSEISKTPIKLKNELVHITISLGVAKATHNIHNLDHLIQKADQALYAAKLAGKNRIEIQ
jgi:diguanylate cyclase (GGDEF)-like protein